MLVFAFRKDGKSSHRTTGPIAKIKAVLSSERLDCFSEGCRGAQRLPFRSRWPCAAPASRKIAEGFVEELSSLLHLHNNRPFRPWLLARWKAPARGSGLLLLNTRWVLGLLLSIKQGREARKDCEKVSLHCQHAAGGQRCQLRAFLVPQLVTPAKALTNLTRMSRKESGPYDGGLGQFLSIYAAICGNIPLASSVFIFTRASLQARPCCSRPAPACVTWSPGTLAGCLSHRRHLELTP